MKHALILIAVAFCMSFTNAPSFSASIYNSGDAGFMLVVDNPKKERLHVMVRHTQLGVVSDTAINSTRLRCRYNLTAADDGQYEVEISNGKDQLVKRFSMQTETKIERTISIAEETVTGKAF